MSSHSFKNLNSIHKLLENELEKNSNTLVIAQLIANLNNTLHSGRYYSFALEHSLKKFAIYESSVIHRPNSILHISTELYSTGGHTRYFENLLDHLSGFSNDLLITNQSLSEAPDRVKRLVGNKIQQIHTGIDYLEVNEKIKEIHKLASSYAYIVLNIHPTDILTIAALSHLPNSSIILINHADHKFWVGNSVIDTCINIRPYASKISQERRCIDDNLVLPIPIKSIKYDKNTAKAALGIQNNEIVFLTISPLYKIIPNKSHNFFIIINKIIERLPLSVFYLIGIEESPELKKFGYVKHPRIKLLGQIEDPSVYQSAADIYIEGFPYNSFTACLESVKFGAIPILHFAPMSAMFNMETELAFKGKLFHSKTEKDYFTLIEDVAKNIIRFQGKNKEVIDAINYFNGGAYWDEHIEKCFTAKADKPLLDKQKEFSDSSDDIQLHNVVHEKNMVEKTGNLMQEVFFNHKHQLGFKLKLDIIYRSYSFQYGKLRMLRFVKFVFTFLF